MNTLVSRGQLVAAISFLLAVMSTPALSVTFVEALDEPGLNWEASPAWSAVVTASARDGVDAARSGSGSGYEHRLSTTVTGPGVLSMWWQVTAGDDDGDLVLEVDGLLVVRRATEPFPWEQLSL